MPTPTAVDITELERELQGWWDFIRSHPELGPEVIPLSIPGAGALVVALLGAFGWSLPERQTLQTEWYLQAQQLREALFGGPSARAVLGGIVARTANKLAQVRAVIGSGQYGLATVFPSPASVQTATAARLADATARIAVWQRAHHGLVHAPLADAQGASDAAGAAQGAATAQALAATVRAVQGVVTVLLPEAVLELTDRLQALKVAQQQANADIRHDLERQTERLTQRIGDLVRWLRTEALPELERELRLQGRELRQAVRGVSVDLAAEADARTGADAVILTQLAPLVAWANGVGKHTTEKVRRNEGIIDELEHLDWSSLLAFTAAPALVALITRLMPPVLSEGPSALAALEGAAASALGNL